MTALSGFWLMKLSIKSAVMNSCLSLGTKPWFRTSWPRVFLGSTSRNLRTITRGVHLMEKPQRDPPQSWAILHASVVFPVPAGPLFFLSEKALNGSEIFAPMSCLGRRRVGDLNSWTVLQDLEHWKSSKETSWCRKSLNHNDERNALGVHWRQLARGGG